MATTVEQPTGPKLLDLAFAMDCTGSMGSYIFEAQQNIKVIVEDIISKEKADVRLALIEYRDHPPQETSFVTKVMDFTASVRDMKQRLDECSAEGGGDEPEAVADALFALLKLDWRAEATKICVFIADAPPHGLGCGGDAFPDGCPCEFDPMNVSRSIAAKGITVYMVGCEPSISPYRDWFMAVAHLTGGQYVPLKSAELLAAVIIGGAQEEISLQQLMAEVNLDVEQQLADAPEAAMSQEDLERQVYEKLKCKGARTKQLKSKSGAMMAVTESARGMSELASMGDVRARFKPEAPSYQMMACDAPRSMMRCMPMACMASPTRAGDDYMDAAPVMDYSAGEMECATMAVGGASMESVEAPIVQPVRDEYSVDEATIEYAQVQRMVQKSLMMKNLKSKCTTSEKITE